jgi:phenylalanyl-tRNA synthetase beta chain
VGVLRHNLARKAARVRVFELGRVFRRDASVLEGPLNVAGISQPMRVAALAYGPADSLQWGHKERGVDFFDIKGDLQALLAPREAVFRAATHPALHPGRCAAVEVGGRLIGHVGELHPQWRQAYELPHAPVLVRAGPAGLAGGASAGLAACAAAAAGATRLALVVGDARGHDA